MVELFCYISKKKTPRVAIGQLASLLVLCRHGHKRTHVLFCVAILLPRRILLFKENKCIYIYFLSHLVKTGPRFQLKTETEDHKVAFRVLYAIAILERYLKFNFVPSRFCSFVVQFVQRNTDEGVCVVGCRRCEYLIHCLAKR